MQKVSRDQLKTIFRKVKHLRLPTDIENVDFSLLNYYAWFDQTDKVAYFVADYNSEPVGIRLSTTSIANAKLRKGFCDLCNKHRDGDEIMLATAKTRKLPKGINYRSRGIYMCTDFTKCNEDISDNRNVDTFVKKILE